ncbi:MAG: FKBP-type peptidyl-prolyl cis-trans isomerase [Neisseriaceae bacterium]|nr:FKBP-type peptidyl-prolyl cis-trans isomerase [Neisseriaceae bacterium]
MTIRKNTVVSLHYKMFDADGKLLDETTEPIEYLHGGYDGIFPLVEEMLEGREIGEEIEVMLQADDAFGKYEPKLLRVDDVSVFPVEVEPGMLFEADDPEFGEVIIYRVIGIKNGKVMVDGNHPLAGMSIRFKGLVDSVREASAEEIAHGHVHGAHGHHH